jgi:hypothetical protein
MFRVTFTAINGGEREIVVVADSELDAVMAATSLRSFGTVLTCMRLSPSSPK